MPIVSLGDGLQQFVSMRNGGAIKTELAKLSESLSTGQVTDLVAELDGDTTSFSGIDYSIQQLDGYLFASDETAQTLSTIQTVLGQVDSIRSETRAQLLLLNNGTGGIQVEVTANAARNAFEALVSTLNTNFANRSLLSGVAVDTPPLAAAEDMLADMLTSLAGAMTAADVASALDTWFDDPAGGFANMGYLGDTGQPMERRISENQRFEINARADDQAIKDVLKAAAKAAVANDIVALTDGEKMALLQDAGEGLFASSAGLNGVQARIGFVEASVERLSIEMQAQKTALEISKSDLVKADPFDTASKLQGMQLQLETHYTVTARLSQLSLLDFI